MQADQKLNHTAAHVLAAAVVQLYPDAKLAIGPAIKEGFYYDFDFKTPLVASDLGKIEKRMRKIISGNYQVQQVAPDLFVTNPYKTELIADLTANKAEITYYGLVNKATGKSLFTDLCKGNHAKSVNAIKHFKLLNLAGAYWRGKVDNPQLTRIYGTAWATKEELDQYLTIVQERRERDHRKIGRAMEIFMFSPLSGQGFPIWLENGMAIKNAIQSYIRATEYRYGFREVETPAFGAKELYEKSGHWDHYADDMFAPLKVENEQLVMRPMTCPHHILIYEAKRRSYRDLPLRMSEQARLYRHEKSGALSGLERVRAMTLTEGHIFARVDQIKTEFINAYKLIVEVLNKFAIDIDYISLSLRDRENRDKYYDDDQMWTKAEAILREVLQEMKLDYQEKVGEAAFYGPKIDIQVANAMGHEITLATLQLDFLLPQKFDLSYINAAEEKVQPVLIHRGLVGTYERFVAILLEQKKGDLPFWIAPKQIAIIPVNEQKHGAYAAAVYRQLSTLNLRINIDERNERLGKKIREAQIAKTKYQLVLGDEEMTSKTVNVRQYGSTTQTNMTVPEFMDLIKSQL